MPPPPSPSQSETGRRKNDSKSSDEFVADESSASLPSSSTSPSPHQSNVNHQIGTASLAMIIFYMVSGGPFGLEGSVRAGGFLFSILGFLIVPILYSVPEALVTAELASTFPEASGGVAWAEEAFGSTTAWIAGKNTLFSGLSNAAIFLVLPIEYFLRIFGVATINETTRIIIVMVLATVMNFINWFGLHVVGKMSMIVGFIGLSPFVVMCAIGIFDLDPTRWIELPSEEYAQQHKENYDGLFRNLLIGNIIWRPFINILFWKCNSFQNASFFAGDTHNVGLTFPRALMIAIVLVIVTCLFPLMVAIGATTSTQSEWYDGYLATAAVEIGGTWLGGWVVAAAAISNVAQYQTETSKNAFLIAGMAQRSYIPKFLATRSSHGTATYALLLLLILTIALGIASFETLVEFVNINYSISALIYFASFIKLRMSCPNLGRPFKVALGTCGCIIIVLPPMALLVFIILSASFTSMIYGLTTNTLAFILYYYKDRIPVPDPTPYLNKMTTSFSRSNSRDMDNNNLSTFLDETENLAPSGSQID